MNDDNNDCKANIMKVLRAFNVNTKCSHFNIKLAAPDLVIVGYECILTYVDKNICFGGNHFIDRGTKNIHLKFI